MHTVVRKIQWRWRIAGFALLMSGLIISIPVVVAANTLVTTQRNLGGGFFESVSMLSTGAEGWAVGHNGLVMHTVDGGASWVHQAIPSGLSVSGLFDVAAVDATHVWAVGRDSVANTPLMLFYNGSAWSRVSLPGVVTKRLMDVDMVSSTVGYAVSMDGFVLGTSNGASWSVLNTVGDPATLRNIAHDPLVPTTLWVISDQGIYMSGNSGATWSTEQTIGKFTDPDTGLPSALSFGGRFLSVYGNTIVASDWGPGSVGQNFGSGAGILSSQDGGVSWNYAPWISGNILYPQMLSATVGYAVDWEFSDLNSVFKTTDGGLTWNSVATVGGVEWVDGIHFINQNVGWVVGENELVVKLDFNQGSGSGFPVANAGPDQAVECTGASSASVMLDGSGSSNSDGDSLTYIWTGSFGTVTGVSPTVSMSLGVDQQVTLTVDDGNGHTATDGMLITVQDTTPPTVSAGPDVTLEATSSNGADYDVSVQASASDTCCSVTLTAPTLATYPLGSSTVTVSVVDCAGNPASDQVVVNVVDSTPPVLTADLTPVSQGDDGAKDDDEGRFRVQFAATDIADANPTITAVLIISGYATPVAVSNGQVIEFEFENEKTEVEVEKGILEIEAPSMLLRVMATDASGNSTVVEVAPQGLNGDNDDESDVSDD